MTVNRKNLYFLQILRGFAAGLVVIDHCLLKMNVPSPFLGAFGVFIFFIISGFIIFHTSEDKFNSPGGAHKFLIRRYIRVAPMYYLATFLILLIDLCNGKGSTHIDASSDVISVYSLLAFTRNTNASYPRSGLDPSL